MKMISKISMTFRGVFMVVFLIYGFPDENISRFNFSSTSSCPMMA